MRKKIALISVVASLAVMFALAQVAQAAYLNVYVGYSYGAQCQPAPDQLSYRLKFKGTVTASGVAKPSKIRIGYQVVDAVSKQVLRSGVTYLNRSSGYKGQTSRFTVVGGQSLSYHLNMKYTAGGKTRKLKKSFPDTIPSAATINAAGLPPC